MSGLGRVLRLGGIGAFAQLGSQQVARRNAATAAATLMRHREEREAVEAFLAQRLYSRSASVGGTGTAS